MSWGAVAIGGATLVGSLASSNAASGAAKSAAKKQSAVAAQQYNDAKSNLTPYMNLGTTATSGLSALDSGDYSGFTNSPDYKSALTTGISTLDRSAAAKGNLASGGHSADLMSYGENMANQYLNSYRNSLLSQAQLGSNSAAALNGVGENAANTTSNAIGNAANVSESADLTNGQSINSLLGQLAGIYGQNQTMSSFNVNTSPDIGSITPNYTVDNPTVTNPNIKVLGY